MATLKEHYNLKMDKYWNGEFARCPICGETMAANACGYWSCLFGCGLQFKRDGSPMLPEGIKPSDVHYSAAKLREFKAERAKARGIKPAKKRAKAKRAA